MKNTNERQKALYDFLVQMSLTFPRYYCPKELICEKLSEHYPRHLEDESEHNSSAFANIRRDVRDINFSDVEKIIVSNSEGYKIATKDEAEAYIKKRLKSNLVSLKLYWKLKHKIDRNGQLDINYNEVESFVGE